MSNSAFMALLIAKPKRRCLTHPSLVRLFSSSPCQNAPNSPSQSSSEEKQQQQTSRSSSLVRLFSHPYQNAPDSPSQSSSEEQQTSRSSFRSHIEQLNRIPHSKYQPNNPNFPHQRTPGNVNPSISKSSGDSASFDGREKNLFRPTPSKFRPGSDGVLRETARQIFSPPWLLIPENESGPLKSTVVDGTQELPLPKFAEEKRTGRGEERFSHSDLREMLRGEEAQKDSRSIEKQWLDFEESIEKESIEKEKLKKSVEELAKKNSISRISTWLELGNHPANAAKTIGASTVQPCQVLPPETLLEHEQEIKRERKKQSNREAEMEYLTSDNLALKSEVHQLKACVSLIKAEMEPLTSENLALKSEVHQLKACVSFIKAEMESLTSENRALKSEVHQLKACVSFIKAEMESLTLRISHSNQKYIN